MCPLYLLPWGCYLKSAVYRVDSDVVDQRVVQEENTLGDAPVHKHSLSYFNLSPFDSSNTCIDIMQLSS